MPRQNSSDTRSVIFKFECGVCHTFFRTTGLRDTHIAAQHSRSEQCPHCPLNFSKKNLEQHIWTHTKPFSCPQCDAKFSTNRDLQHHLDKHENVRYPCGKCGKTFATKHLAEENYHASTETDRLKAFVAGKDGLQGLMMGKRKREDEIQDQDEDVEDEAEKCEVGDELGETEGDWVDFYMMVSLSFRKLLPSITDYSRTDLRRRLRRPSSPGTRLFGLIMQTFPFARQSGRRSSWMLSRGFGSAVT